MNNKLLNAKELKEALEGKGDVAFLAEATGFNISYVRKVLAGQRQNAFILQAAKITLQQKAIARKKIFLLKEKLKTAPAAN